MKISELRMCDQCGGALTGTQNRGCPLFYAVDVQTEAVDARAINTLEGLRRMTGNTRLAEVFSPYGDEVSVNIGPPVKLLFCNDCMSHPAGLEPLLLIVERRNKAMEAAERSALAEKREDAEIQERREELQANAKKLLKQGITRVNPDGTTNTRQIRTTKDIVSQLLGATLKAGTVLETVRESATHYECKKLANGVEWMIDKKDAEIITEEIK